MRRRCARGPWLEGPPSVRLCQDYSAHISPIINGIPSITNIGEEGGRTASGGVQAKGRGAQRYINRMNGKIKPDRMTSSLQSSHDDWSLRSYGLWVVIVLCILLRGTCIYKQLTFQNAASAMRTTGRECIKLQCFKLCSTKSQVFFFLHYRSYLIPVYTTRISRP